MPRRPQRLAAALPALVLVLLASTPLEGQQQPPPPRPDPLRVYLDCQTRGCAREFFRTELEWVSWVRDRQSADVHLIITSQSAGGGGDRYTLDFIGRGAFAGQERQLVATTSGDATDDERRTMLVERIGLGLVPYALATEAGQRLLVTSPERAEGEDDVAVLDDPWDFWVFSIRLNGELQGESRQSSMELESSVSANRTTEAWKINAEAEYRREDEHFELEDDRDVDVVRENWNAGSFAVRSVADHWALGVRADVGKDTRLNQDFFAFAAPGIEFSVFPYEQFTRRSLTLQYLVGVNHFQWADSTIYNEIEETRFNESLTASLDLVQPWGGVDVSLTGAHYFHDLERWNLDLFTRVEVRLFQGFSFNVGGSYRWIRDQLHIPKAGLSDEDVLLELQELETDFDYRTFFGVTYRFGSIFNNVVNPRFGGLGGGGGGGGGGRGGFDRF